MISWIVSSGILITAVIALRCLLKGKISLRLQYALWGLVLLRLLIPVNLGSSSLSVMNALEKTQVVQDAESVRDVERIERRENGTVVGYQRQSAENIGNPGSPEGAGSAGAPGNIGSAGDTSDPESAANEGSMAASGNAANTLVAVKKGKMTVSKFQRLERMLMFRKTALPVWLCGMILLAVVFAVSNIRFAVRLRRTRRPLSVEGQRLPVYLTEELETPCLFGIFRPAIYVTEEAAENDTMLRHTVEHEATHFRHGDHVWAVLRGVCLALHWYNPLVWWAAALSRNDAELACDEATIKRLGEAERGKYGCTLIGMTCQRRGGVLVMATTMVGSGRNIKERITLIVRKPKTAIYTLLAVVLVAAAAAGCTFTGGIKGAENGEGTVNAGNGGGTDNTGNGNGTGSNGQQSSLPEDFPDLYHNIPNYCLTSLYTCPEDVDLEMLFYNGFGIEVTEEDRSFLESQGAWMDLDIIKIPGKKMEEVLEQFFDLTLEETHQVGINNFYYNEDTDMYYLMHNDANGIFIEIEEEYTDEDGRNKVVYRRQGESDRYLATLVYRENRYIFLSNLRYAGTRLVAYSNAWEYLATLNDGDIEAFLEEGLEESLTGLYADYNGETIQRIVAPGEEGASPATRSDVIFYRPEQEESVSAVVEKMIEAMLTPLTEPSDSRPYTVTDYRIETQELLYYYSNNGMEVCILPFLDVYYSYDGIDLVSMEAYRSAEPQLEKDGLMPLQKQGSESVFVFLLLEKDGVYRLQRAEAMMTN